MSPFLILGCIGAYFLVLLLMAWWTSRHPSEAAYFIGNKDSPWYVVAFGLIGDSLSGVTYISVPGAVGTSQFAYLQVVLGYVVGYWVIARLLLPLYYRLNLISIYSYLDERLGPYSQKTGSGFFLVSRLLGAGARLYLAASVLQQFVFDAWGVPFGVSVAGIILLILAYTYRGGIKTLVWTDALQSAFLLFGVIVSLAVLWAQIKPAGGGLMTLIWESPHSKVFFWDWHESRFFWKQFLGGMFIAIVMTGLDQNSMQKNLSCRSLREAQRNLYWFSGIVFVVNLLFLALGALLYAYVRAENIPVPGQTDQLFPVVALRHAGTLAGLVFLLGLAAATFSSADSVLTTLTTSFYIDILRADRNPALQEASRTRLRHAAHLGFALLLLGVILGFRAMNNSALIDGVLKLATYTYGPLLGLFAFGLFTRRNIHDAWVPLLCVGSPMVCYVIERNVALVRGLEGYKVGFELLIFNGLITFAGLCALTKTGPRAAGTP